MNHVRQNRILHIGVSFKKKTIDCRLERGLFYDCCGVTKNFPHSNPSKDFVTNMEVAHKPMTIQQQENKKATKNTLVPP